MLKNHQQWFNLQWSKAENNPGWAIGFSKTAHANTSSACPNQFNFCSAASAAASNKTVTTACQNVGVFVANAVLASRIATDGFAEWSPLSLSLNNPANSAPLPAAPNLYVVTANNNLSYAQATSGMVKPVKSSGDASPAVARNALYSDAILDFAPYGGSSSPGVPAYSLAPQLAAAPTLVASAATRASAVSAAAANLTAYGPGSVNWTVQQLAAVNVSSHAFNTSSGSYSPAQQGAFFWRLGGGSLGLGGTFSAIAAFVLDNTTAVYGLQQTAQLFAQLHTAIFDAAATAWTAKQATLGPGGVGGERPETDLSPTPTAWQPLLANPPYPAFPSAHAAICTAATTVLSAFFGGSDLIPLSGNGSMLTYSSSDSWQLGNGQNATGVWAIKPTSSNTAKQSWTNFSQIATACAQSRVAGGVQYPYSVDAGQALGAAVAADVVANYPGSLSAFAPTAWRFLSYTPPAPSGARLASGWLAIAAAAAAVAALLF